MIFFILLYQVLPIYNLSFSHLFSGMAALHPGKSSPLQWHGTTELSQLDSHLPLRLRHRRTLRKVGVLRPERQVTEPKQELRSKQD